ncbi:MAE_28990/MAE_18760 family HEPN-like nuclease [Nesterenkonia alkaliphila]|uniref:MAE-28990/MAE-18760-like HEPN domain-containing protein n=1 Tax=Nesterenkonia alkaliphila TaxID=1463631 RepID=A0A7K1UGG9_9MICC|nr:MAE_28990/MAE_18760 family HEPN-like nuclease [Nesterenkonia alkaliphila]MVT25466.1 hypothetical protein [Nesterenkonia alkaliphila]GFZ81003.1 hypothetical protein GCM10011359_07050 [Nesterenkonia alkaliphila]
MQPSELEGFFEERFAEIRTYLELLEEVDRASADGAPRLKRTDAKISPEQKRILNSSLYLQLYNLVEATVSRCLDGVAAAVAADQMKPNELAPALRREWVRSTARTHIVDLKPEKRLEAALAMCEHLVGQLPIENFSIDPGGGGNWDDSAIEKLSNRFGCNLSISEDVSTAAKRHIRDDMGALKLVKDRRNGLAHGSLSFVDCSDGVTVSELQKTVEAVGDYLEEVVKSFAGFIQSGIKVGNSATGKVAATV